MAIRSCGLVAIILEIPSKKWPLLLLQNKNPDNFRALTLEGTKTSSKRMMPSEGGLTSNRATIFPAHSRLFCPLSVHGKMKKHKNCDKKHCHWSTFCLIMETSLLKNRQKNHAQKRDKVIHCSCAVWGHFWWSWDYWCCNRRPQTSTWHGTSWPQKVWFGVDFLSPWCNSENELKMDRMQSARKVNKLINKEAYFRISGLSGFSSFLNKIVREF